MSKKVHSALFYTGLVFYRVVFLITGNVQADNLFEQIGWKGATSGLIFWLVSAFLVLLVALTLFYLRSQFTARKIKEDASETLFDDLCVKADLYPLEKSKLKDLLKHEFIPFKHTIFQSASLFERCVDAEVKLLLLTVKTTQELEELDQLISAVRKKIGYGYLPLEHPLLSSRNLEIGQAVSVFPPNGKQALINHAVVIANREMYFRISFKIEGNKTVQLPVGSEVKIAFARQGDAVYGMITEVADCTGSQTLDCRHTLTFQRNQLRQFVRMEVNLPLRIRRIAPSAAENREPFGKYSDVKLSDISGGGVSFLNKEPYTTGEIVSLQFTLTTGKFAGIKGRILRVSNIEVKDEIIYRHHVQFIAIEQYQRDKIIRFIFDKQRMQNQIR